MCMIECLSVESGREGRSRNLNLAEFGGEGRGGGV